MSDQSVSVRVPVSWGDMDALGHVNNTIYLRWFETARIAWAERFIGKLDPNTTIGPILARTEIDYLLPVTFPDTITVTVEVLKLGTSSIVHGYRVISETQSGALVCQGQAVLVLYDYGKDSKVPIDPELRARIAPSKP